MDIYFHLACCFWQDPVYIANMQKYGWKHKVEDTLTGESGNGKDSFEIRSYNQTNKSILAMNAFRIQIEELDWIRQVVSAIKPYIGTIKCFSLHWCKDWAVEAILLSVWYKAERISKFNSVKTLFLQTLRWYVLYTYKGSSLFYS